MDCRNPKNRQTLIDKHQFKCLGFYKLLKGQTKTSCTKDKLTDKYYFFQAKDNMTGKIETFFVGTYAGDHFLNLLKIPKLERPILFNPLLGDIDDNRNATNNREPRENHAQAPSLTKEDKIKKKLLHAINIVIIKWNSPPKPNAVLLTIKKEIEENKVTNDGLIPKVKAINTIIGKDAQHPNIYSMLEYLEQQGNNIKSFNFDILSDIIQRQQETKKDIKNNFKRLT